MNHDTGADVDIHVQSSGLHITFQKSTINIIDHSHFKMYNNIYRYSMKDKY